MVADIFDIFKDIIPEILHHRTSPPTVDMIQVPVLPYPSNTDCRSYDKFEDTETKKYQIYRKYPQNWTAKNHVERSPDEGTL